MPFHLFFYFFKSDSKRRRFGTILKFYYQVQNGVDLVLELKKKKKERQERHRFI